MSRTASDEGATRSTIFAPVAEGERRRSDNRDFLERGVGGQAGDSGGGPSATPSADDRLRAGDTLIVLGSRGQIERLEQLMRGT